ncbi:MAG: AGE family epimerase/isomerase [Arenimonas sp.]|nr:AGE family epimerase/isomerase [Hydrogenophaga sp.]MBW8448028.1 AGE family epimerase/isomerase [Arenimonas sp.]
MSLDQLKALFVGSILPTWGASGFDDGHGQFVEYLELDGRPQQDGIVRTRTIARQIYVHAHASALGVAPPSSLALAERAFDNLHRVAWVGGARSGYARAFDRSTEAVTDPVRDLYDNACVLLALSWLLSATGKEGYRRQIDLTIAAIDRTLKAPFGGWAEDSDGTLPRRQNPHMHYLEATLSLCETSRTPTYRPAETRAFALLQSRFLLGPHDLLHENFGPSWEIADTFGSQMLEPGHMCEWVWLTGRHDALTQTRHDEVRADLLANALRIGRSDGSPFLVDQALASGTPVMPSRRLWPQVEMLKALMTQHRRLDDGSYLAEAETLSSEMLTSYFQDVPTGCWHDRLDINNQPIGGTIPASSLYHLWTAVAELV